MLFNSPEFWIFFAVVLIGFYSLPYRAGKVLLLGASYFFYMWWNVYFIALILASTVIDYFLGILLETARPRWRKPLLIVSIVANLGFLGFFKYYNFFASSLAALLGLPTDSLALNILLPVGISFYTFASLSYTIDVYRRKTTAVRNFIDYAFFIAFFPHLIAGPILRAKQFLPQIQQWQRPTAEMINRGIALILTGLIKKMVFADRFAIAANAYFNNLDGHPGWLAAWSAAFAFTLQLFFDFSGYTDIARGCAKLLGFEFPINFARPALARNPIEFWQRWHITLSLWVRDYLFLPLTRSRRSRVGVYLALLITMVLVGLWHGARWNFVVWGAYCGVFMILTRLFQQKLPPELRADPAAARVLAPFKIALTFAIFVAAMALFRSQNIHDVGVVVSAMFDWTHRPGKIMLTSGMMALFLISLGLAVLEERRRFLTRLSLAPAYVQVPAFVCFFFVLELFSVTEKVPFVYFQF